MIMSWFKSWLPSKNEGVLQNNMDVPEVANQPEEGNYDFYANYFSLFAEGARLKLVETMFSLNVFTLFENNYYVLEQDIIEKLGLMPLRAKKWLYLLTSEHFLRKIMIDNQPAYELPEGFIKLMHSDRWWEMQFFFSSWMVASEENLIDVLRYGKVKTSVSWPPKKHSEVLWLEDWMHRTAEQPINCILEHINFNKIKAVLDVGGGDGTMACAFATAHPHLKAAVYNLPMPAQMARRTVASKNLNDRVRVIEGNFIEENEFPKGFDLILFTRVLFDWDEATDRKLLKMAYQALPKNGFVGICEYYKEENHDRCLASEYRYIFHDDFTPNVMKTTAAYRQMLHDIGFTIIQPNDEPKPPFSYCSLILAQK